MNKIPLISKKADCTDFFLNIVPEALCVFLMVFSIIIYLSIFAEIPKEDIVGTIDESYLPRPEWYFMWIFELLTFFPGSTEVIGSLGIPILCAMVLLFLPFIEKSKYIGIAKRPLATAVGVSSAVVIVYLTITAFAGAHDYGKTLILPDRQLTQKEKMGMKIYVQQDCAYCHQTLGEGGRRVGPDISNIKAKGRTPEYLAKFIKDPQSESRFAIMPKYNLKQEELSALADFMLAMDFSETGWRRISKEAVIEQIKNEGGQNDSDK